MYEGDAPLAERRAQALTLDRDLLRELLGQEELRELLDPAALADLELALQAPGRRAAGDDRRPAPRPAAPARRPDRGRGRGAVARRRRRQRASGSASWPPRRRAVARPDRRRAALDRDRGRRPLPRRASASSRRPGVPLAFLGPTTAALEGLLARCARTHGPFLTARAGTPLGPAGRRSSRTRSGGCSTAGSLLRGEFRPGGAEREWCDPEVLRQLRRRSLARLRREVEPVEPAALGPVPARLAGGRPLPGSAAADGGAAPSAAGRARAARRGRRPAGRVCRSRRRSSSATFCRPGSRATSRACSTSSARSARSPGSAGAASAATTAGSRSSARGARRSAGGAAARASLEAAAAERPTGRATTAIRAFLGRRGASFYRELHAAAGGGPDREVLDALWDLVWAGEVTNDTFAPLRALRWARPRPRGRGRRPGRLTSLGPPEAAGRWSLVDGRRPTDAGRRVATPPACRAADGDRARPRPGPGAARPPRRPDPRGGRRRGRRRRLLRASTRCCGRSRRPAGSGAATSSTGSGPPSSPCPARSTGCAPSASRPRRRPGAGSTCSPPPTRPTRTAPRSPGRAAATTIGGRSPRAAGAYVVLVDGVAALYLERGGRSLATLPAADDPDGRRARAPGARRRSSPTAGSASCVVAEVDGGRSAESPLAAAPARGRLRRPATAGLALPPAPLTPDRCPRATRSTGPPTGCGRTSSAGRSPRPGPRGPGAVPQVGRVVGRDGHRRRGRSARTS